MREFLRDGVPVAHPLLLREARKIALGIGPISLRDGRISQDCFKLKPALCELF
jgi:hypothetical protein